MRVVLWNVATGKSSSLPWEDNRIATAPNVVWAPGGDRLVTIHATGNIDPRGYLNLWEITTGGGLRHQWAVPVPALGAWHNIWRVQFSPNGKLLAAGTEDETILLLDAAFGREVLHFHGGVATAFAADGRTMLSVSGTGGVRHWRAGSNELLAREPRQRSDYHRAADVLFSRDARQIAVSDGWSTCLLDATTGKFRRRLDAIGNGWPRGFSPDGKLLAVLREGGISLFDTATGGERAWLAQSHAVAFSPTGDLCACADGHSVELQKTEELLARRTKAPLTTSDPARARPGVPLQAEISARQDTYCLDFGGLTLAQVAAFGRGEALTPHVDLVLKLRNTGNKPLKISRWRGDLERPWFHLVGPGAINLIAGPRSTALNGLPPNPGPLVLAPGATHTMPIQTLDDGDLSCYWVLPGTYQLHGTFGASISPAPAGAKNVDEDGFSRVYFPLAPIKLQVLPEVLPAARRLDKPLLPKLGALVPPPHEPGVNAKHRRLATRVALDQGIARDTPLEEVLTFLRERYDLSITVDVEAFRAAGVARPALLPMMLPKVAHANLESVLHLLLEPIDADFEIQPLFSPEEACLRIVPLRKARGLAERLAPWRFGPNRLLHSATIRKTIPPGTPLEEALVQLSDLLDDTLILDRRAFVRAGIVNIGQKPVALGAQDSVAKCLILEELLQPLGAKAIVCEFVILVVPLDGSE